MRVTCAAVAAGWKQDPAAIENSRAADWRDPKTISPRREA
jgi:hypothetical protein